MNADHLFIDLRDPLIFDSFGGDEFWEKENYLVGDVIVKEGEDEQDFYYLFSGSVKVMKSSESHEARPLATLHSGDFFGEGALLSSGARGANVIALSDCVVLKMTQKKFHKLVKHDPEAAMGITLGIVKVLSSRLSNMNGRMVALYNVARLTAQYEGDHAQVIPAVFKELIGLTSYDQMILFGHDALPRFKAEAVSQEVSEAFAADMPSVLHQFNGAGAPNSVLTEVSLYCPVRNASGALVAVLAIRVDENCSSQDQQLFMTVADQLGPLFSMKSA